MVAPDAKIMLTAVLDRIELSIQDDQAEDDLLGLAVVLQDAARRLKPDAIEATQKTATVSEEIIPVYSAGTTKMVRRSLVLWIEAQGDYARLHTAEGSYLIRVPLSQLEARWTNAGFLRIHRSYMVAVAAVTEFRLKDSNYSVRLGDVTLPVSRRFARRVSEALKTKRIQHRRFQ